MWTHSVAILAQVDVFFSGSFEFDYSMVVPSRRKPTAKRTAVAGQSQVSHAEATAGTPPPTATIISALFRQGADIRQEAGTGLQETVKDTGGDLKDTLQETVKDTDTLRRREFETCSQLPTPSEFPAGQPEPGTPVSQRTTGEDIDNYFQEIFDGVLGLPGDASPEAIDSVVNKHFLAGGMKVEVKQEETVLGERERCLKEATPEY